MYIQLNCSYISYLDLAIDDLYIIKIEVKMAIVYFDEAGNTGADLMNTDQTIYVLCSSILQEKESKKIIENYFGKNKRIHFKTLKNAKRNQESIINLLKDNEYLIRNCFRSCYYHKKYLIVCQMLNYLYEPQLFEDNIDYYDGGMNIAHANMFFICGYTFCGNKIMDDILRSFVDMIRIRTNTNINAYYKSLENAMENCINTDFGKEFYILYRTKNNILKNLAHVDKYILDPAMHALIGLVEVWLKELNASMDIVHDRSNSVNITKKYLEFLVNIDVNPINIGYGEYKALLPLKVKSFKFVSSESSYSIQLCDLLASSIFFINNDKEEIDKKDFKEKLIETIRDWKTFGSVFPSTNVSLDPKRKKQIGDIDPINYLAHEYWKCIHDT